MTWLVSNCCVIYFVRSVAITEKHTDSVTRIRSVSTASFSFQLDPMSSCHRPSHRPRCGQCHRNSSPEQRRFHFHWMSPMNTAKKMNMMNMEPKNHPIERKIILGDNHPTWNPKKGMIFRFHGTKKTPFFGGQPKGQQKFLVKPSGGVFKSLLDLRSRPVKMGCSKHQELTTMTGLAKGIKTRIKMINIHNS